MINDRQAQMVNTRQIQTIYYFHKTKTKAEIVKINHAVHANSAVLRCIDHMQLNDYGATSADVFDERDGVLHAVITRDIATETIKIVYKRPVKEGM